MNALPLQIQLATALEAVPGTNARFHQWRGQCIEAFTRVETAVVECLVVLSAVPVRGAQVGRPHLHGQRLDALAKAIGEGGPFALEGAKSVLQVERCREQAELRNLLCHGTAKIAVDAKGEWTATIRLAKFQSEKLTREVVVVAESEAATLLKSLARASQSITGHLDNLRHTVEDAPTLILKI